MADRTPRKRVGERRLMLANFRNGVMKMPGTRTSKKS
jgi:hypothetical protein